MISQIAIQNFKCLRDVSIHLEKLTVFVGPNASGKSSILQGIDYLCNAFRFSAAQMHNNNMSVFGRNQLQSVENELSAATSRGANEPVSLAAKVGGSQYRYRSVVQQSTPRSHSHQQKWNGEGLGILTSDNSTDWKKWDYKPGHQYPIPLSVLLKLETSKLIHSALSTTDNTIMAPDGSGLHSALASMALNDPDSWQALQEKLRWIIPTIRRLRHTKSVSMQQPPSLLFDTVGANSLPASQVSEGTLLVLGLLAALYAPNRPSLILLDDLDRGLHPKAQKELINLLRGLMETNPALQILASTHSPYMLDCLGVNEVRMTFMKQDGGTVCAALADHPRYPKWKDEMTPGEMWSVFGEKWVAEKEASE